MYTLDRQRASTIVDDKLKNKVADTSGDISILSHCELINPAFYRFRK